MDHSLSNQAPGRYYDSSQKPGRVNSLMLKEEKVSPEVRELQEGAEAQETTEGKEELTWTQSSWAPEKLAHEPAQAAREVGTAAIGDFSFYPERWLLPPAWILLLSPSDFTKQKLSASGGVF